MATAVEEMDRHPLSPGPGRPAGLPNTLPSIETEREYLRKLRQSADLGDCTAMAMLVLLGRLSRAEKGKRETVSRLLEALE